MGDRIYDQQHVFFVCLNKKVEFLFELVSSIGFWGSENSGPPGFSGFVWYHLVPKNPIFGLVITFSMAILWV